MNVKSPGILFNISLQSITTFNNIIWLLDRRNSSQNSHMSPENIEYYVKSKMQLQSQWSNWLKIPLRSVWMTIKYTWIVHWVQVLNKEREWLLFLMISEHNYICHSMNLNLLSINHSLTYSITYDSRWMYSRWRILLCNVRKYHINRGFYYYSIGPIVNSY